MKGMKSYNTLNDYYRTLFGEKTFKVPIDAGSVSYTHLREQYILKQRELGVDLFSIARELGLKTMVTLEKYK